MGPVLIFRASPDEPEMKSVCRRITDRRPVISAWPPRGGQWWLCGLLVLLSQGHLHAAEKKSDSVRLLDKLASPMTSVVDGRSFRAGIHRIADGAQINTWIDRQIDPSRLIDSGSLGPTVYDALKQLASDHGCVIMPTREVLLVGSPKWVDRVATLLRKTPASRRMDVAWPRLSTPDEARQSIDNLAIAAAEPLPHDLWPAGHWKQIESSVAQTLIESQFDLDQLISTQSISTSAVAEATKRRAAIDRKLVKAANAVKPIKPNETKFSLTTKTRAANILRQLCGAAGLKCIIAEDARTAGNQVVSIEATDVTLRTLILQVAKQAEMSVAIDEEIATFSVD